ncbi:hypothetical protein ACFX2C_021158 [Malus domestica]
MATDELEDQARTETSHIEVRRGPHELYGDILESILSRVPLLHLVPACHVSKSWKRTGYSSLRRFHRNIKPWLIVLAQATRSPYHTTAHAYDPDSHAWIDIHSQPMIGSISTLRSSNSLLYALSPSKFAFSTDPLHYTWHMVDAPLIWRTDPITGVDSIPAVLEDSAASTWLSVAVDDSKMYVMDKGSGVTCSFDPDSSTWSGPYDLRPDETVFSAVIGFADDRLILVGAVGSAENLEGVKVWEVNGVSFECKELVGEMPEAMVEKLKGESDCVASIGMSCMGHMVCLHNPWSPEELILCELAEGGCSWGSVRNAAVDDRTRMQKLVVTCSKVGLPDLHKALQVGALRLV